MSGTSKYLMEVDHEVLCQIESIQSNKNLVINMIGRGRCRAGWVVNTLRGSGPIGVS